jgi:hypothetical protein
VQVLALSARDWGNRNCELRSSLSIGFGRAVEIVLNNHARLERRLERMSPQLQPLLLSTTYPSP